MSTATAQATAAIKLAPGLAFAICIADQWIKEGEPSGEQGHIHHQVLLNYEGWSKNKQGPSSAMPMTQQAPGQGDKTAAHMPMLPMIVEHAWPVH